MRCAYKLTIRQQNQRKARFNIKVQNRFLRRNSCPHYIHQTQDVHEIVPKVL